MTTAKCFFSQTDDINTIIAEEILAAKEYVLLAMYTLTNLQLVDALKKIQSKEVEVLLIFDQGQMQNNQKIFFAINNAGINFRTLEIQNASMHHKFIVIDDVTTITGSFNWTYSAQRTNYENIILINDTSIAGQYKEEFNRIWHRITSTYIDDILKQKERLELKEKRDAKERREREKRDAKEKIEKEKKEREEREERDAKEKIEKEYRIAILAMEAPYITFESVKKIQHAAKLGHQRSQLWLKDH